MNANLLVVADAYYSQRVPRVLLLDKAIKLPFVPEFSLCPAKCLIITKVGYRQRQLYRDRLIFIVGIGIKPARHRHIIGVLEGGKKQIVPEDIQEKQEYKRP